MAEKVRIHIRRLADQVQVIEIHGEVTSFAEDALMGAYLRASQEGAQTLILNCTDLEFMNSSGIGLLITLLVRATRQNQQIMAVGLNQHFQRIFELTRLNDAIPVYASEAEAIAALASKGQAAPNHRIPED